MYLQYGFLYLILIRPKFAVHGMEWQVYVRTLLDYGVHRVPLNSLSPNLLSNLTLLKFPHPQSRQSAKLILQSSELGLPQLLTRRRVCPSSPWFRGEGHTRWPEKGWESPNSDEGTYCGTLYIYVLCAPTLPTAASC